MRVIAAGSAVVLTVVGIFLVRPAPLVNLDHKVGDLLTGWAGPGKPSGRVVIVEIDETSLTQFGPWPWPRDLLGRITRRILDRGAATVVFDMMFPQEDRRAPRPADGTGEARSGTNDEALADALSGKPTVAGYTLRFEGHDAESSPCSAQSLPLVITSPNESGGMAFFRATSALCSVPAIAQAAAGNGFLNAGPDSDGKMRRIPLVIEYGSRYYPSLALAALNVYQRVSTMRLATDARGASRLRLDNRAVPLEGPSLLRLRFRGARRTFPYVSVAAVLAGRVPEEMLRGNIVIIGGSAPGLQNLMVTPADALFPDVEIQATAIDNLLQGDSFHRPGDAYLWELALALVAGLISTFLLVLVRSLWGALITLGMAAGVWTGCTVVLSATGMLFSPLSATAALSCNLSVLTLLNYLQEKRRADRTERQLVSTTELSREVLQESESRYQRLVENVNDAIIMDDVEGRLVFANRRFREWFGLEARNIRDVILEDYVAPEWRAELRDRHNRRMRGETVPDHYEYEGVRPDGTRLWIEALVTKVEEDGQTTGSQAALRDITERKRIEAQYLQAQKMESVGRLAGGVAHDFNNLLTVINGYSALLLDGLGPEDESRASLEQIRQAGEHAAELTKKLLAFSRRQLVQPKALDLNLVVADAEKMFRRLIGEDIEVITQLSPALGQVMADPGHWHQVLMNLVVNARDSMPHGGKVIIETKNVEVDGDSAGQCPDLAAGSYVYLGVTDTGMGMSKEVKQHLFEPFFTTKEPGKGTGLGLATIYGIVQQSAGWIEVTSDPGQGTAFHIYLPRIQPDLAKQPSAGLPAPAQRGSETVLVVEDQDAVRHLISNILEGYGHHVLQASSGPDAIALAERYPDTIHLLLTDVVLPLMNGRVVAEELRAARPGIKVLYISGYTEETIGERGVLDSDLAYLQKPFTPEALAAKVRETLADGGIQHRAADS
ncbi:MAG: CHASE2 domain-containing protein [Acidobacteriia bacterium]|nr:CHASE2 domain-containing protein [Terriglobia bacterium]